MMGTKGKFILILMALFMQLGAQDPQFSQFYAAPLFLNPAFTGLTYEHRFTANYRNQWPGIKSAFTTYMASYDYNISDLNSGVGGYFLQDRIGTTNLVTTQGSLSYAYRFRVNKYSEIRVGLSGAMAQKKVDFTKLILNDQLVSGAPVSQEFRSLEEVRYVDVGGGALFNSTNYWIGVSAKHLNEPNTSMTGNTIALPVFLSAHGGYRYIISAGKSGKTKLEEFISGCMNLRTQQKYSQMDIGAYYYKSFVNLGLWYRGLPFKRYKPGYVTRESIIVLLGVEIPEKNYRFGYSYDFTISGLGLGNTQGAHEVSMVFEMAGNKNKHSRKTMVSCPKF